MLFRSGVHGGRGADRRTRTLATSAASERDVKRDEVCGGFAFVCKPGLPRKKERNRGGERTGVVRGSVGLERPGRGAAGSVRSMGACRPRLSCSSSAR